MRFTLDTNCIIDVEDGRTNATFVKELASLDQQHGVVVGISAIGASERRRDGGYAQSFTEFQSKLEAIGFGSLELLPPLAYCDITYCDYCVAADESDTLEQEIHQALFPSIPFRWSDYMVASKLTEEAKLKKWRNAKCDVLSVWCHIKHRGDVFVTSDSNFHAATKQSRLRALGAGAIAHPLKALAMVPRK